MPTKLKIFAIAAALAAGTSSAAMAQDVGHGPWSNTLSICRTGYIYDHGVCQPVATPGAAQAPAPATTAFDGTYAGVSRTLESTMEGRNTRGCVLPNNQPGPLTIAGGVVRYSTDRVGTAEGSVNAQGVLAMHGPLGMRFEGQIDGRGTVTGRFTGGCSYQMVWQKEGK